MNMLCLNEGKKRVLDMLFSVAANPNEDMQVELYSNDYTPVDGSVFADFTAATFSGAGPVTITNGSMPNATIVSDEGVTTRGAPLSWTHTGGSPQTVYGWFLYGDSTGLAYFAQRFDTPRTMNPGDVEQLDPTQFKSKTFA